MMFLIRQELQKIVKDLFLLINETNADKASQEVLVKTGMKMYSLSTFSSKSSNCSDLQNAKYFLLFSVSWDGWEPWRSGVSKRVHWSLHGTEEVQHDAHSENHRRLHRRGHFQQSTAEIFWRTPDLNLSKHYQDNWAFSKKWLYKWELRFQFFVLWSISCRFMSELMVKLGIWFFLVR